MHLRCPLYELASTLDMSVVLNDQTMSRLTFYLMILNTSSRVATGQVPDTSAQVISCFHTRECNRLAIRVMPDDLY